MQTDSLQYWVDQQMIRGRYIFTKEDVLAQGLSQTDDSIKTSLSRLTSKGVIVSPWKNFYVTVPTEFRLRGEVPPVFYIDRLMKYLGRDYYVSLLTAAAYNGAGHQRTMVFQVTVNGNPIRSGIKNGVKLEFTLRNPLPMAYVKQVKTQNGFMNVSTPELTALDLVCNEDKIGGLSRTAEVLMELAESMRFDASKAELLKYFNVPVIQRLGYLLDLIEEHKLAESLLSLAKKQKKVFRRIRLKQSKPQTCVMETDDRWKIIINQEIETDNI